MAEIWVGEGDCVCAQVLSKIWSSAFGDEACDIWAQLWEGGGEEDLSLYRGRILEVGSVSWWIWGQTDLGLSATLLLIN